MKTLLKKLRSTRGTSLVELLCCTLILLLVSGGMVSGITFAANQFREQREQSNARILSETLTEVVTAELLYTSEIVVDDPTAASTPLRKLFSRNYSNRSDLTSFAALDSDGEIAARGELALGIAGSSGFTGLKLISSASYTDGMEAAISVLYNPPSKSFTATLTIFNASGEELNTTAFDVIPVNSLRVTAG